jgi:hypothetical protein
MIDATVLVVGCGPTGIAHELLRRGISCRLAGKRPAPQSSTRAFTVHARTMEMLTIWAWREAYRCNGEGKMVLVRPDLYVDYVSSLDDVEGLSGHMQQHWLT